MLIALFLHFTPMSTFRTLVIDPKELANVLAQTSNSVTVLDIRSAEDFAAGHIPGAHHVDPSRLNRSEPPAAGLLPAADEVAAWTAALGLSPASEIVVYDGGQSTSAARAVWVLNAYGFNQVFWLNGGIGVWQATGNDVSKDAPDAPSPAAPATLSVNKSVIVDNQELAARFSSGSNVQAVDARSAGEYEGSDVRSARGGHMPNAVHYEWLDLFTETGALKPEAELRAALTERSLEAAAPTVVYCQSHQRSAVTYVVLKHLGFTDVAALDGAWSRWGNDPNTPIET